MSFPERLNDADAIANYIAELSDYDVDTEFVAEVFEDCCAVLAEVPVANLIEGDADHNIPDKKKQVRYNKLLADTMPPILVEDGVIQDGHHRYRAALVRGESTILCYVVQPIDVNLELGIDVNM